MQDRRYRLAALGGLCILFALLTSGAIRTSVTADEPTYIACGYGLLARGREVFPLLTQRGYTPLLIALEALPLYLTDPHIPVEQLAGWPNDYTAFAQAFRPYLLAPQVQLLTRMPTIFLTVLLAAVVWRWGKDLWGAKAGLLALGVAAFDPLLLAHGRLANSDAGTVAFGTAALYLTWRWRQKPAWRLALATGVLWGCTMLCKASGILWVAASGSIVLLTILQQRQYPRTFRWLRAIKRQLSQLRSILSGVRCRLPDVVEGCGHSPSDPGDPNPASFDYAAKIRCSAQDASVQNGKWFFGKLLVPWLVAGGLSLLILWAGYGFEWGPLRSLPLSVPAPTHWENLLYLDRYSDSYFALGLRRQGGWWWYFPLAFAIKNPLPLLIGLGIGLIVLLRRAVSRWDALILGLFPLLYTCTAMLEGLNLGYRFMLPIHPFLYLTIGGGLACWMRPGRLTTWRRGLVIMLGLWYVVMTVWVFPNEIAYFNELVGGPDGGYRYLSDSNVDWGQSSNVLQDYLQKHPEARSQSPDAKFNPAPGEYIVGASRLQGVGMVDPDTYAWFRQREPQTILAHSLLVYDAPPVNLTWMAQCDQPALPLDDAAITKGAGRDDLRQVNFDCTRAWLYPGGASGAGIYALHRALLREPTLCLPAFLVCPPAPLDSFVARHLAQTRLTYEQRYNRDELPAFVLYEAASTPLTLPADGAIYAATTGIPAADFAAAEPLKLPVRLKGPLELVGTAIYRDGGILEVETWWRVMDSPIQRPFSLMGHLVAADGQTVEVVDGLGMSPAALASGDIIVQRHRFAQSAARPGLALLTGAYWSDTVERWDVEGLPGNGVLLRLDAQP